MSGENVEIVRRGYEQFRATGQWVEEFVTPDFVWDMSNFRGWPEDQVYDGSEGARRFLEEWSAAWDDWELEVDALHEAGDKVLALVHQHGRSKTTGMPVEMSLAQIWTLRDGKQTRMDMYSDQAAALEAVSLEASASSRPNLEVVRAGFEVFNSGDVERIVSFIDADFEVEVPPGLSAEPDTYRGEDGIRRYFQSFQDVMDDIHFHAERFWEAGENVVVDTRVTATGKQTAIPVEQRAVQVWTIRDGRTVRIRAYASVSEALAAVGLAE